MSAQPIQISGLHEESNKQSIEASFKVDSQRPILNTGPQLNIGPTFCADGWPKAYALQRSCARSSFASKSIKPFSVNGLTLVRKPNNLEELRRLPSQSSFNTASSWLAPKRPDRIL